MLSRYLTILQWQRPKPIFTAAKNLKEGDEVNGLFVARVEVWTHIAVVYYYGIPLPTTYPKDFTVEVTTIQG